MELEFLPMEGEPSEEPLFGATEIRKYVLQIHMDEPVLELHPFPVVYEKEVFSGRFSTLMDIKALPSQTHLGKDFVLDRCLLLSRVMHTPGKRCPLEWFSWTCA